MSDDGGEDPVESGETATGTFLVTEVDNDSAILHDVETAQIHTLGEHPNLVAGEVLEATVATQDLMGVTWGIEAVESRREIPIERVDLEPTTLAQELAAEQDVGEITRREREGEGEVHVLTVDVGRTADAAAEVAADEETLARAARLGVDRVEIRASDGVLSVRYLPE